ncbi:MAG TPA: hypothetical protein VKZ95_03195 [Sphingobacteriaceae bacterium]|nr:hypothetical protein [Sphingobacteriaceae bacterium]
MKKLLLIPMLMFATLASNAQDTKKENRRSKHAQTMVQKTPEERAEMQAKRMAEQLSLTKEQQEKMYKLSLEQTKKRQAMAESLKEENKKHHQEIESLLNQEQKTKWNELKSKQEWFRKGRLDSQKRDFKRKPGMIKKPDSTQSRRPAVIKPVEDKK